MTADHGSLPEEISRRARQLLVELCALSSPTGDADGVRAMAARLAAELGRRGLVVRDRARARRGRRAAAGPARPRSGRGRPLPAARRAHGHGAAGDPAAPRGRPPLATGALDMKGGLAMLVGALDLLAATGGRPCRRPPPASRCPTRRPSGVISEQRWSAAGASAPGRSSCSSPARRAATARRWSRAGAASPSGSSRSPAGRPTPAWPTGRAARRWPRRPTGASGRSGCPLPGPGRTVNVGRLVGGTADFVDALGDEPRPPRHLAASATSIADRAVAEGEVRYLAAAEGAAVIAELAALAAQVAAEHEVAATLTPGACGAAGRPARPGRGAGRAVPSSWRRRAASASRSRGPRRHLVPELPGRPAGVPVVDGLGPVGDGMHTRDEWLDLRSLERRIVLLADLLATL